MIHVEKGAGDRAEKTGRRLAGDFGAGADPTLPSERFAFGFTSEPKGGNVRSLRDTPCWYFGTSGLGISKSSMGETKLLES